MAEAFRIRYHSDLDSVTHSKVVAYIKRCPVCGEDFRGRTVAKAREALAAHKWQTGHGP